MKITIGVLICHVVAPELESLAGDYGDMFETLFADYGPDGYEINLRYYDLTAAEYPERLDECDGYVTSGAAASVNDREQWISQFEAFTRLLHQEQVKLFAVCFGHQMVAKALGGRVEIAAQGWGVGVHDANVKLSEPWMNPSASSFQLINSHQEQVSELPRGAIVLASSSHCPVSMFRCGTMIGVQGHPEFRAPYARALMNSRSADIPAETRQAATTSFTIDPDHALLASWIVNYLSER